MFPCFPLAIICPVSFQNFADNCEPKGLNTLTSGLSLEKEEISLTLTSSLIMSQYFFRSSCSLIAIIEKYKFK
jgi:hypothetical protein